MINPQGTPFVPNNENSRLQSWISGIEGRMDTLETSQGIIRASIRGGALKVYTDEGDKVATLGDGSYTTSASQLREVPILGINNPVGRFHLLIDTEEGLLVPRFNLGFVPDTFVAVTSSSYVNCYKTVGSITGIVLVYRSLITADSGTNGKVRLQIGGQHYTDEISVTGGNQVTVDYAWDLTGKFELGDPALRTIKIQGVRTAGVGNLNVYAPDWCYFNTKSQRLDATTTGIPSD